MKKIKWICLINGLIFLILILIKFLIPHWWFDARPELLKEYYNHFGGLLYFILSFWLWLSIITFGVFILTFLIHYQEFRFRLFASVKRGIQHIYQYIADIKKGMFQDVLQNKLKVSNIFFRSLAFVYGIGFVSLLWQFPLISEEGLIPYKEFVTLTKAHENWTAFFYYPSVFWISQSDFFIRTVLILASLFSFFSIIKPTTFVYFLLWIFYLSIVSFGRDMFQFPWDTFLLEIGFVSWIALFFIKKTHCLPRIIYLTFLMLFFRQWYSMSLTKLLWADDSWYNLTYMKYYWLYIPSPNPIAWYFFHLPMSVQKLFTFLALVMEMMIPVTVLMGKKGRIIAFFLSLFISLFIQFTGNFSFFNILTIIIGLWCLDDQFFKKFPSISFNPIKNNWKIYEFLRNIFLVIISISLCLNVFYLKEMLQPQFHKGTSISCGNYSLVTVKFGQSIGLHYLYRLYTNFKIVSPHGVFKTIPKHKIQLSFLVKDTAGNWVKLEALKGKEITNLHFNFLNTNRLQFHHFYKSYGVNLIKNITVLYPNMEYVPVWTQKLVEQLLVKPETGIHQLFTIPEYQMDTLKIMQNQYIPSKIGNYWESIIPIDSLMITPNYEPAAIFNYFQPEMTKTKLEELDNLLLEK